MTGTTPPLASVVAATHAREHERMTCPSIYATTLPGGRRLVRRLAGAADMTRFGGIAQSAEERTRFRARIISARHGPIDHGIVQFTPHTRVLEGDNFGHDHPVSRLVIVLNGSQTVHLAGRDLTLTPGAGILVPGDLPHSYEVSTVTTRLHIDISADDPRFVRLLKHVQCGHWPTSSPVLTGLGAFVRTLLQRDDAKQSWVDRMATRSMLEAMLCSAIASAPPPLDGAPATPNHRELALQHIRLHHTDPDLTAASVARNLGLSPRTLQRAFLDDTSVAQWIGQFRLDRLLAFLRDPRFTDLTIAELGRRAGYGSSVSLRRAVVAATGLPPSTYREIHLAAAQASRGHTPCHHGPRSGALPPGHPVTQRRGAGTDDPR